jgi:hypothetical protein
MKWIPDKTGRFARRPYYEAEELNERCEQAVVEYLVGKYGAVVLPISTDDLTVLIERDADLDLYADLREEEGLVEGVTDFFSNEKPRVRISKDLSEQEYREHRLRTTLTHEYAHVLYHAPLYNPEPEPTLFAEPESKRAPKCHRDTMLGNGTKDWLEWQAGFASGALLMPRTHIRRLVDETRVRLKIYGPAHVNSSRGRALVSRLSTAFDVSRDAARVRLQQLGYLVEGAREPSCLDRFVL